MKEKKILIFHIGELGDTLVSLPSIWAVREHFPNAHLVLLYNVHIGKNYVSSYDILENSELLDGFLAYPVYHAKMKRIKKAAAILKLLSRLRSQSFDTLVYLVPSRRSTKQITNDIRFFRLAGIRHFIGTNHFQPLPKKNVDEPTKPIPQEGDLLLTRLANSGIPVPPPGKGRLDLNIGEKEEQSVERWLNKLPSYGKKKWIAIGPGSKVPAKIWPVECYLEVVQQLIEKFDIWPVIFGGIEDKSLAQFMVSKWQRGYIAAGLLTVREAIAALKKCVLYLGNDTGVIHMAATAGIKCVGIYSARDYPGNWEPYGNCHIILRKKMPCELCMLDICNDKNMECIRSIKPEEVYQACTKFLSN